VGLALLALGAAASVGLRLAPERWIEAGYAGAIYPQLTRLAVPVTSLSPLPLTPLLALVALLALVVTGLSGKERRGRRVGALALTLLLVGASWFLLGWGLSYGRAPAERLLSLPESIRPGIPSLLLADLTAELHAFDDAQVDEAAAIAALARAIEELADDVGGVRPTLPSRVHRLPPGTLLTFGSAGIVSPFTLEAHVDGGLPPAAFVAVAAHELAHLAGFAGEADAELIGAVAGLTSDHPFARYSVALTQGWRLAAGLDDAERASWLAALPQRARNDLAALRDAGERYRRERLVAPIATLYDGYLRLQGVSAGNGDYDRTSDLLIRAYAGCWLGRRDAYSDNGGPLCPPSD
jgi:hypothetical protein